MKERSQHANTYLYLRMSYTVKSTEHDEVSWPEEVVWVKLWLVLLFKIEVKLYKTIILSTVILDVCEYLHLLTNFKTGNSFNDSLSC